MSATAFAEETAAGGRVVAAPSNGSAGPVAALLSHFRETPTIHREQGTVDFLLMAAAIGGLLRTAGLVQAGGQSEVGVAAAMAAAGYAATQGGTNDHVLMDAELALEPHVGLVCDPGCAHPAAVHRAQRRRRGPCRHRRPARAAPSDATASLDALTGTMIERGRQMAGRHKQASLGGIAVNVADC